MNCIRDACFPQHRDAVESLLADYARSLSVDLAFQDFANELAELPGAYARPAGRLLVAWRADEAMGCVALRPHGTRDCELKRLYVRPAARGEGLGERLVRHVIGEARAIGYRRLCLDTLPEMAHAQRLYERLGFLPIEPYTFNPVAGTQYLGLNL